MLKNLLDSHLSVVEKVKATKPVVFIYKGFPVDFLKELHQHIPHLSDLQFITADNFVDLEEIKKNVSSLERKLKQLSAKKSFLIYEEFLLVDAKTAAEFKGEFKLVINNFYDFIPNQSKNVFTDIEDSVNNDIEIEDNELFNLFYADCTNLAGTNCIQHRDLEIDKEQLKINTINFFDVSYITLPEYREENSKPANLIQFKAADGSYHKLKFDLFSNSLPASLNLLVNENIEHITRDHDELKMLCHILSSANCKIHLYRQEKKYDEAWRPELETLLKEHWSKNAQFKELNIYQHPDESKELITCSQGSVVEHIIRQVENAQQGKLFEDVFLTAPTGAGKSLLFQLPAMYLAENKKLNSVTVVISPLKSLMADQVWALNNDRNFSQVAFLNSDLSLVERQAIIEKISSGEISLVYMSPELLLGYGIKTFIGERELGLMVIDEAHLVTTWGRDFRVDYWFLGNYIRALRRSGSTEATKKSYRFPVVALTATAVYTGVDDMVFETIESLNMQNCRIYIGGIKRDEISFHYQPLRVEDHDADKLTKTSERIRELVASGKKSIFYFPWIKHIESTTMKMDRNTRPLVRKYHADLDLDERTETLQDFKSGEIKAVLATKAFGMGVDISDIENVYHHAPSGSLADYVQEIGRVARAVGSKGRAMVDYHEKDLKYSRLLFSLSSLKQYQVFLAMKKINLLFKARKDRNMLVSVEDLQYIFARDDREDVEQKVKSALLVLEKDLHSKFGYPVLMVRPQSLFLIVYGSVLNETFNQLKEKYGEFVEEIHRHVYAHKAAKLKSGAYVIREENEDKKFVKIRLDRIWQKYFPEESFRSVKSNFFKKQLLSGVEPFYKIEIHFPDTIGETRKKFENLFTFLEIIFSSFAGKSFSKIELMKKFKERLKRDFVCRKIVNLLTGYYSETAQFGQKGNNSFTGSNFLTAVRKDGFVNYKFTNSAFYHAKSQLIRIFQIQFEGMDDKDRKYIDFVPVGAPKSKEKNKMAYLLETFELATYEVTGVESPQLFVRINDPQKLNALSNSEYRNRIVSETERRHKASMDIMSYFFQTEMKDEERWNYIEDYFLGREVAKESMVEEEEGDE